MNNNQYDEILWQIAKKRAAFKWAFSAYVFVNAFLIAVWFFTTGAGKLFLANVARTWLGHWNIISILKCIPG